MGKCVGFRSPTVRRPEDPYHSRASGSRAPAQNSFSQNLELVSNLSLARGHAAITRSGWNGNVGGGRFFFCTLFKIEKYAQGLLKTTPVYQNQ